MRPTRVCAGLPAALAVAAGLLSAPDVAACACCAEPGMRKVSEEAIQGHERDEFARIVFGSAARLYTDASFPDNIRGVDKPSQEPYRLAVAQASGTISFEVRDKDGRTGRVELAMPRRITRFEIDPRDGRKSPGGGPQLYKEWRLIGEAKLTGILATATRKAKATLILHGSGNGCSSAEDFRHWTLGISGTGVQFRLLGGLDGH